MVYAGTWTITQLTSPGNRAGCRYLLAYPWEYLLYGGVRKMALVYIVEDDKNIQEIEEYVLKSNGYDTCCFDEAKPLDRVMQETLPDLILLDIMLPDKDGLSVLKNIRNNPSTKDIPVILVTAKTSEIDTVKGLDTGADDYIAKPFGIMELLSRVKALLRRARRAGEDTILSFGEIVLNQECHTCTADGSTLNLTFKEYELLKLFLSNAGIVLTREMIMNKVWGSGFAGETRTIDVHIKTLRKKLGEAGSHIVTVRNVGYRLE